MRTKLFALLLGVLLGGPAYGQSIPGSAANQAGVFSRRTIQVQLVDFATDVTTGTGKFYLLIPPQLNGMNLVGVRSQTITAGTTNVTSMQITRCAASATGNACSGTTASMLTTVSSIDSGENSSDTATAAVIDTANDDVVTGQVLRFDITAVSTTAPKGWIASLEFQLP